VNHVRSVVIKETISYMERHAGMTLVVEDKLNRNRKVEIDKRWRKQKRIRISLGNLGKKTTTNIQTFHYNS